MTKLEQHTWKGGIALGILALVAATPRLPDPRWRTVGAGALAARPATCAANLDVYICNGAGCAVSGAYHYCIAPSAWADPFAPAAAPPQFVTGELPVVDAVTGAVTLANIPAPPTSLALYVNGVRQAAGTDYTLTGAIATPLAASADAFRAGLVLADYRR